jgi:hypothetical protein
MSQIRHARRFAEVEQALIDHRYATALVLARRTGLLAAVEAGGDVGALAQRCGLARSAVEGLLWILASAGWVEKTEAISEDGTRAETWRSSPFARAFLADEAGAGMLDLMGVLATSLPEVEAGLRDGRTPDALDVRNTDGPYRAFLAAVNGYLHWAVRDLLRQAHLPPIRRFIAGSMGVSASALVLGRHPEARVTYGCLSHLVAEIPDLIRTWKVPTDRVDGMHAHGGEPENDDWHGPFDLVFLTRKMILDPAARVGERFAGVALQALAPGGVAVFWETVHADGVSPFPRAMEALFDVCASPGAPPRRAVDHERLLSGIGYARVEVVHCLGGQTSFVLAHKGTG